MKKIINYLIIIVICAFSLTLNAQTFNAEATLDSNHILIGDHLNLHLRCTCDKQVKVLFPILKDTCFPGLEIIEQIPLKIDTNKNQLIYKRDFVITSFDSGIYFIPSLSFYNSDSVLLGETSPLQISVQTLVVDTASALIKGIKPPLRVPLTFKEIAPYLLIGILILGIIALIIILILRIKKKKPILPFIKEKPSLPAHIIALQALEKLRLQKLWQQGEFKQYYSELTDILRIYLKNRWNIQAMEMVSDEIIDALYLQNIDKELIQKIKYTLSHADSVKFAKGQPISDENQLSFDNIVYFVNETKLIIEESKEKSKEK